LVQSSSLLTCKAQQDGDHHLSSGGDQVPDDLLHLGCHACHDPQDLHLGALLRLLVLLLLLLLFFRMLFPLLVIPLFVVIIAVFLGLIAGLVVFLQQDVALQAQLLLFLLWWKETR